nr:hypothetical protein [Tanacetum cinerariifolium]
KDLRYPLVDQLEGLKDAPMDVIMASLYLESDTRDDAPQVLTHTQRLGHSIKDAESAAARVATRLCGGPCRRWVIGRGLCLAVMKCGESLELRHAFADVISAGISKGVSEGLRHGALKDLRYPLVDQLEGLKDAPMDVIMASLYLESDTRDDAPQYIRDLRPSSS